MLTIGLVYGYGQKADGRIDEQTLARCHKALALYRAGTIHDIYLTTAAAKNGRLMADEMAQFFRDEGVYHPAITVVPRATNTAGETDVAIATAELWEGRWKKGFKIIPISTWYHAPRIWWLWLCRGKLVKVGISWPHAHWADLRIEPFKIINALLRPRRSAKVQAPH